MHLMFVIWRACESLCFPCFLLNPLSVINNFGVEMNLTNLTIEVPNTEDTQHPTPVSQTPLLNFPPTDNTGVEINPANFITEVTSIIYA